MFTCQLQNHLYEHDNGGDGGDGDDDDDDDDKII